LLAIASLAACTAPVSQSESTGETSEALATVPYQISPSYASSQCVESAGGNTGSGAAADTWTCTQSADANWNIVQVSSGIYEIHQAQSGNCLTANGGTFTNGNSLVLWGCNGQVGSRWNVAPVGSYYTFTSIDNTSKCIDVSGSGSGNGTKMDVWSCSGGTNQQFALAPTTAIQSSISAGYTRSQNGNQYTIKLTVSNSSVTNASNWQVALNLWGATINGSNASNGGTAGVTNGSVYYNNGLAILTPANGQTLPAGASTSVTFTASSSNTNWWPTIETVDGVSGTSAPMWNDGIDHVSRAVATAALNTMVSFESNRTTWDGWDDALLDSYMYAVSSDGSQIVFDPSSAEYSSIPADAAAVLAAAQMDPSVASYLVAGLLSCFGDANGAYVYGFDAAALRGWSFTTTPENLTVNAPQIYWGKGTDNIYRVGVNVNGAEQIQLKETVNPNSEDIWFGLVKGLSYTGYTGFTTLKGKFHGSSSATCTPFNGPGGSANPYLVITVNGSPVSARSMQGAIDCPYSANCISTAVIDPVGYATAGQIYSSNGNLIGPSNNPFALDPNTLTAYSPDHQGQWAQDPAGNWGQFSVKVFSNGRYWYQWRECAGGRFNANGC
jgi:hypothetical protein